MHLTIEPTGPVLSGGSLSDSGSFATTCVAGYQDPVLLDHATKTCRILSKTEQSQNGTQIPLVQKPNLAHVPEQLCSDRIAPPLISFL